MRSKCEKCGRDFNDAFRSTVCPHREITGGGKPEEALNPQDKWEYEINSMDVRMQLQFLYQLRSKVMDQQNEVNHATDKLHEYQRDLEFVTRAIRNKLLKEAPEVLA